MSETIVKFHRVVRSKEFGAVVDAGYATEQAAADSGKFDAILRIELDPDTLQLWFPEGCTPADAAVLRRANHALAQEAHLLAQAAEQFLASCKDGNAGDLLGYYAEIFSEALSGGPKRA